MRIKTVLSVVFVFVVLMIPSQVLANSISDEVKSVEGKKCNVVTVNLNDTSLQLEVVKGNNQLIGAEPFTSIVDRTKPEVAVNANFFDAYKTFIPMDSIIAEGEVLYVAGNPGAMLVNQDGSVQFGKFKIISEYALKDTKSYEKENREDYRDYFFGDGVNLTKVGDYSVCKYTPYYGATVELPEGRILEVKNNTITNLYFGANQYTIPKDGYLLYMGNKTLHQERIDYLQEKIGTAFYTRETAYEYSDGGAKNKVANIDLTKVRSLISASPLLIEKGQIVVEREKQAAVEAKIHTLSAQRTAIGITAQNKLRIVTCVATVDELATIMQSLGCVNALNLDGGGSSALYANGKYLQKAGRALNTVLVIKQTKPTDKKTTPAQTEKMPAAQAHTAKLSLNGEEMSVSTYLIDDNNYFKMRDIAMLLRNTNKKMEMKWDDATKKVVMTFNQSYTPVGGELAKQLAAKPKVAKNKMKFILDGQEQEAAAYLINGNNYFKLRELSELFDFVVDYDDQTKTVIIKTE